MQLLSQSRNLALAAGAAAPEVYAPPPKHATRVPLAELLAQMDAYDWDSVDDLPVDEGERKARLTYLWSILSAAGLKPTGTILDLASGITSVACLFPDAVAVDSDLRKVKILQKSGIRAVVGDIEDLPFEDKSFDYVVCISPPQRPVVIHENGYVSFRVDREHNRRIVEAALRIARRNVLIVSYGVYLEPPYEHLIEKKGVADGFYEDFYVLYRAGGNMPCPAPAAPSAALAVSRR